MSDSFLTHADLKQIAEQLAAEAREAQLKIRAPGASRWDHAHALGCAERAEAARKAMRRAWRRQRNDPLRLAAKLAMLAMVLWASWWLGRLMGRLDGCLV